MGRPVGLAGGRACCPGRKGVGTGDSMAFRSPCHQRAVLRSGPPTGFRTVRTASARPGYAGVSPGLPASVTNDAALVSAEPGFVTAVRVLKVTVARSGVSANVV